MLNHSRLSVCVKSDTVASADADNDVENDMDCVAVRVRVTLRVLLRVVDTVDVVDALSVCVMVLVPVSVAGGVIVGVTDSGSDRLPVNDVLEVTVAVSVAVTGADSVSVTGNDNVGL